MTLIHRSIGLGKPRIRTHRKDYINCPGNCSEGDIFSKNSMAFFPETENQVLMDQTEDDLDNIRRIARNPDVMRYVLIWLEDDEQIAAFLKHGIEESRRIDRMGYYLAARNAMTGEFAGLPFPEIDPKTTTTGEVGFVLLPEYQA